MVGEEEPHPERRALLAWIAAYAALLVVVFVAYRGTLDQGFVADDFAHLLFLREAKAPLWRYLSPTFSYSDPVTVARYLPVKLYLLLVLERRFGLDAAPYHAIALLVHALNALLVGHLARTSFRDRTVGALSALLFAVARVNAQNVCWVGCFPNLVGATFLFASVALYLRRGAWSWTLGPVLLFLSFCCRPDALASVAFLVPLWIKDAVLERRSEPARFAIFASIGAVAFLVLSFISLRHFPEPGLALGVSPRRFYAFGADLFAPWEAPAQVKAAVVIGVVVAAAAQRDRRLYYALYGLGVGAALWTVLVYLKLTPRYFYVYTALSSMVVAVLLRRACCRVLGRQRAGAQRGAALALGLTFCGWNLWQVQRTEVVWFDYLSIPGRKLLQLYQEQRAQGATRPLRVRMEPHTLLTDADLAYFKPYLEVVKDGAATVIVDTEAARFVRYYGSDFGNAFWFFPWFEP
jgi:hypothetical protein